MRAWDLAVFIILIEMSLGFLAGLPGLYNNPDLVPHDQGGEILAWQSADMNNTFASGDLSIGDYLTFGMTWILASFFMMLTVLKAFFAISLVLYQDFGLPAQLCLFVQGIVYLIYTWAIIQWKSGRGGQAFE